MYLVIFSLAFFNVGITVLRLAEVQSVSLIIFPANFTLANREAMGRLIFRVHTTPFYAEILLDVFNHLPPLSLHHLVGNARLPVNVRLANNVPLFNFAPKVFVAVQYIS